MRRYLPLFATALALVSAVQAGPLAAALQPFVDQHELAGAVALVADKDKVLSARNGRATPTSRRRSR